MGRLKFAPSRIASSSSARLSAPIETRSTKQTNAFYLTKEWKAFRNQLIKQRGWRCQDSACETPRGPWKQIYGHHVVEIRDGGSKLDDRNVLLVCGVCHGRLTKNNKASRIATVA